MVEEGEQGLHDTQPSAKRVHTPNSFVEGQNLLHVLVCECPVVNGKVCRLAFRVDTLWDNGESTLDLPSDANLSHRFLVRGGNLGKGGVGEDGLLHPCVQPRVRRCAQRGEPRHDNPMLFAELCERRLGVERVDLHLYTSRNGAQKSNSNQR